MRTFKFRVWSRVKKAWMQEMCLLSCVNGLPLVHLLEFDENKEFSRNHIFNMDNLDPVIQQYTGAKSKSGKEIYEGDILKTFGRQIFYTVVYCDKQFSFIAKYDIDGEECWVNLDDFDFEVVGNIFEG